MSKSNFQYAIGDAVGVPGVPLVTGIVIGRVEYARREPGYLIEYSTLLMGQASDWFGQTIVVGAAKPSLGIAAALTPARASVFKAKRKR